MKYSFKALSKICATLAVAVSLAACSEKDDILKTITFEGDDWSVLIDSPQYGGPLLYGEPYTEHSEWGDYTSYKGNPYLWTEVQSTLSGGTVSSYGSSIFWNGGDAISNYAGSDLSLGTSDNQLTVYCEGAGMTRAKGGNIGSDNFIIHTGVSSISFKDSKERLVKSVYVNNTLYTVNVLKNGNYYCPAITEGEWMKVIATGYDAAGNPVGKCEFNLAKGPSHIVTEWTKWDLSSLGKVQSIEFSFEANGNLTGSYGLNAPAYCAFDDFTVEL